MRIVGIPDTHGDQDNKDLPAEHMLIHAGVRKTNGCRQTAYMGCPVSKAAQAIIAAFDMDATKWLRTGIFAHWYTYCEGQALLRRPTYST